MSNEIEATKRGVSVIIDGAIYELPILSAYDRADLLKAELAVREKARADERAQLIQDCKDTGLSPEQTFAELRQFADSKPKVTQQTWIDYVNDPLNEVAIVLKSLSKIPEISGAEDIAKKASLTMSQKAEVCGLVVTTAPKEGDDSNPTTPPTYSPEAAA